VRQAPTKPKPVAHASKKPHVHGAAAAATAAATHRAKPKNQPVVVQHVPKRTKPHVVQPNRPTKTAHKTQPTLPNEAEKPVRKKPTVTKPVPSQKQPATPPHKSLQTKTHANSGKGPVLPHPANGRLPDPLGSAPAPAP
jgi:hypothetical protein